MGRSRIGQLSCVMVRILVHTLVQETFHRWVKAGLLLARSWCAVAAVILPDLRHVSGQVIVPR